MAWNQTSKDSFLVDDLFVKPKLMVNVESEHRPSLSCQGLVLPSPSKQWARFELLIYIDLQ